MFLIKKTTLTLAISLLFCANTYAVDTVTCSNPTVVTNINRNVYAEFLQPLFNSLPDSYTFNRVSQSEDIFRLDGSSKLYDAKITDDKISFSSPAFFQQDQLHRVFTDLDGSVKMLKSRTGIGQTNTSHAVYSYNCVIE